MPLATACALPLIALLSLSIGIHDAAAQDRRDSGSGRETEINPLHLRAHHATALVQDLDRAVQWYRTILGFTLSERGSRGNTLDFAELTIPGYGVALVRLRSAIGSNGSNAETANGGAASKPAAVNPAPANSGWTHIVFAVPDADRVYRLLKERGAEPSLRPGQSAAPVTSFTVHDSEGNEIEILSES